MSNEIFFKKTPRMTLIGACRFFGVERKSYAGTIVERIYENTTCFPTKSKAKNLFYYATSRLILKPTDMLLIC